MSALRHPASVLPPALPPLCRGMRNLTAWGVCALLAAARSGNEAAAALGSRAEALGKGLPPALLAAPRAYEAAAGRLALAQGVDSELGVLYARCARERFKERELSTPVPWR